MARPKKGQELVESVYLGVRVPLALKEALERVAAERGTDTAAQVRAALESYAKSATRKVRK